MIENPPAKMWRVGIVVVTVLFVGLAVIKWHVKLPMLSAMQTESLPLLWSDDSGAYLNMAQDGVSQIPSPYSKRFLYPWLARNLSQLSGCPIPKIFLTLDLTALAVLAFCLAEILRVTIGKPFLALSLLLTPFPLESFELGYLPDLFHIALVSAFFLLLLRENWKAAMSLMFLGFLVRENTLVLCLFTMALAWFRNRKTLLMSAAGVLLAGWSMSSYFGRLGKPNLHHLPDSLYLLGKVPYYFLLNIFGLRIWSNLRPGEGKPFITWELPHWMKHVADTSIGIAYPDWRYPISTLIVCLTVFGIGPLLIFYLWRQKKMTKERPFAIELALYYGLVSFLIGSLLGDWVDRLVGYGWPLFWIAGPVLLFSRPLLLRSWRLRIIIACYLLSCWWPRFFGFGNNRNVSLWAVLGIVIIYLVAGVILWRTKRIPNPPDPLAS